MSDDNATTFIGRDGAGVPDRLNNYRHALGEGYLRKLDAAATYFGPSLVGQSERELEALRAEWESSLESPLDHEQAAQARRYNGGIDSAQDAELIAREELLVQEGRSRSPRHQSEASQQALEAARAKVLDAEARLMAEYSEYEGSGLTYDADGDLDMEYFDQVSEEQNYHHSWMTANEPTLARLVAVDRELAIAGELRELELTGESRSQLPANAKVKEIGTDASVLLAERGLIESGWDRRLARPEWAQTVYRDEVPHPPLLDSSYDVLPARRSEDLAEQLAPLEEWVAEQPDAWVEQRHAALGAPTPLERDGEGARRAAWLGTRIAIVAGDRDLARDNAALFATSDPQRAGVEATTADAAQAKLDTYERELDGLRREGRVPDGPTPLEQGVGAQQQVYAREYEIRRQLVVAQGVERSIVEPSGLVRERLGPAPEARTPERREWEELVEEVEGRRLDELSARQECLEPEAHDPAAEQALEERIGYYRAETGLDPAAQEAQRLAVDSGGPGYG
jgi:hypothetical protein